ncbi:MAG: hydroxyacylglutathione hydrolase [Gammaproteobacteria bacterium]|nr:hydroxyacylglutathione hydrolase [Gammaproteobacteria bacterium]
MHFNLIPLPALRDNYIWLLAGEQAAIVVDPGEPGPALRALADRHLVLAAIFITHHHADHMSGAARLAAINGCPVYGPARESIAAVNHPMQAGQCAEIPALQARFQVLDIPGHTAGHIAYHGHNIVFCGDTLFSAGCGRLFEGTAAQMNQSLGKLAALPDATSVCCGHEYTVANLRFAQVVEPQNREIRKYAEQAAERRRQNLPTLPSDLARERLVNPFLRCREPAVIAAAAKHAGHAPRDEIEVFAVIRSWKNTFT